MSTEEQEKKDEFFMSRALQEAEAAYEEGEIPIGAVVVCRGRIIARAHNMTETLHDGCQQSRRQIPYRLHPLRHRRAVPDVRRSLRLVADGPRCLRSARHQAWLPYLRAVGAPSKDKGHGRCPR